MKDINRRKCFKLGIGKNKFTNLKSESLKYYIKLCGLKWDHLFVVTHIFCLVEHITPYLFM